MVSYSGLNDLNRAFGLSYNKLTSNLPSLYGAWFKRVDETQTQDC